MSDNRIIGGLIYEPGSSYKDSSKSSLPGLSRPVFLPQGAHCTANGRSALFILLKSLPITTLWLPDYYCDSVLSSAELAGVKSSFYPLGPDLICEDLGWLDDVGGGHLVMFIDYFGFRLNLSVFGMVKDRGAMILEDASQALLTDGVGDGADFVVYSPRKFFGLPDGGILVDRQNKIELANNLEVIPDTWWNRAVSVLKMRADFDSGLQIDWHTEFRKVEDTQPTGYFAMSPTSERCLTKKIDLDETARIRRDNYGVLLDKLKNYALFTDLPAGVVPVGFPLVAEDRDRVQRFLFDHRIFPPIHWKEMPESAAGGLATRELTLPCDQRYCEGDMVRVAEVFSAAL